MRSHNSDELTGRDYLRFFPVLGEMLFVTGDKVIRARFVGAFKKHIVVGVARYVQAPSRSDNVAVVADQLQ